MTENHFSLSVLHSLSLCIRLTRLYAWNFRSRLAKESLLQTFLSSALNTFFPKRFRYCINATCYLTEYWSPHLQRRINLYPQVFPTRALYPWRYKPLQRRRHMDFTCSQLLAPLPKANYATTVVSTAWHWTNYLFPKVEPSGMKGILSSPYLK